MKNTLLLPLFYVLLIGFASKSMAQTIHSCNHADSNAIKKEILDLRSRMNQYPQRLHPDSNARFILIYSLVSDGIQHFPHGEWFINNCYQRYGTKKALTFAAIMKRFQSNAYAQRSIVMPIQQGRYLLVEQFSNIIGSQTSSKTVYLHFYLQE
ncbi:MAG: hypothetical protein RLY16_375 [Bacteroidota bacterium]|jgi:hypothetical protein